MKIFSYISFVFLFHRVGDTQNLSMKESKIDYSNHRFIKVEIRDPYPP